MFQEQEASRTPDQNRGTSRVGNDAFAATPAALGGFLADTYVLMTKTQVLHWNGTGPGFHALHELTEAQYREMFAAVDLLAERMRALRQRAPSSLAHMLQIASLDDRAEDTGLHAGIRRLAEAHAALAARARDLAEQVAEAGDPATENMLVARIAVHEKAAWLLRGHLG